MPVDASDSFAATHRYVGSLTRKATDSWLAALLNSDDYRARAAGLFLDGKLTGGDSLRPMDEATRNTLVQLAVGAGDPAVYAMAVYACRTDADNSADGACPQISLRAWARLDSDNAVPWLLVARQAQEKHDEAGEMEAFVQAAKSHKSDSYNDSLFAFAEPDLPKDVPPLERWYLSVELLGIEAATGESQYSVAARHCSNEALRNDNVRQQCDALATLFVAKGASLLDLGVGAGIGARVGWSAQRVAGIKQERDALMQALTQAVPTENDDLWSCDTVRLGNAFMNARVRLGEVGAAREALERSGESEQELAQKHTESLERLLHDAQQRAPELATQPAP